MKEILTLKRNGSKLGETAVLFRSGKSIVPLEAALFKAKIPYVKYGGIKFFERTVVRDILAFQKILLNRRDEIQWLRILSLFPGIGEKTGQSCGRLQGP